MTKAETRTTQPMTLFIVSPCFLLLLSIENDTTMIERNEREMWCLYVCMGLSNAYSSTGNSSSAAQKQFIRSACVGGCTGCVRVFADKVRIKMVLICVSFAVKYSTAQQKPRREKNFVFLSKRKE